MARRPLVKRMTAVHLLLLTIGLFFGSWLYCFVRYPVTLAYAPLSAGIVSIGNTFGLGGPLTYWVYSSVPMTSGPLSVSVVLRMVLVLVVFIQVWFYVTHRILHLPLVFRQIHYLHHTYRDTNAYCAQFAHPLEFVVGNLAGVILVPCFYTIHRTVFIGWVLFCLHQSILSHGLVKTYHSVHHHRAHVHFGISGYLDTVFGTHSE